jgi:anti-sigma B factor antagonist
VALKITLREVDGVNILDLQGRIARGEESDALRKQITYALAAGQHKIVLNMEQVIFLDSAGLSTLVAAQHSARSQGAALKLCNLGIQFQEIFEATGLLTVFEVCDSEAAAIGSFSQ